MSTHPKALIKASEFARTVAARNEAHRLAVGSLVLERTGDVELSIGALMHDVAEGAVNDQIAHAVENMFGPRVARVVGVCSDNGSHPEPPFRDLDEARVAELFCSNRDCLIVAAADAMCALEASRTAWASSGTSPRVIESSIWFWRELSAAIEDRLHGWSLAREFRDAVLELDDAMRLVTHPVTLPAAG